MGRYAKKTNVSLIYSTANKVCFMFVGTGKKTGYLLFPVILVVKALDSPCRVPGSNLQGGFKIKVISAFHPVKID